MSLFLNFAIIWAVSVIIMINGLKKFFLIDSKDYNPYDLFFIFCPLINTFCALLITLGLTIPNICIGVWNKIRGEK